MYLSSIRYGFSSFNEAMDALNRVRNNSVTIDGYYLIRQDKEDLTFDLYSLTKDPIYATTPFIIKESDTIYIKNRERG